MLLDLSRMLSDFRFVFAFRPVHPSPCISFPSFESATKPSSYRKSRPLRLSRSGEDEDDGMFVVVVAVAAAVAAAAAAAGIVDVGAGAPASPLAVRIVPDLVEVALAGVLGRPRRLFGS